MSTIEHNRNEEGSAPSLHDPLVYGFTEAIEQRYPLSILETLLKDMTTGRNIIWADNEYEILGKNYMGDDEITIDLITGLRSGVIKPRIAKEREQQSLRTRNRAEVFTPSWLCNQMNNHFDKEWFGREDVFNIELRRDWKPNSKKVEFPEAEGRGWTHYVTCPRLEITCGEAPFICSRYDTVTGAALPVESRIGFLDRKLRIVSENTETYDEWIDWAFRALKSTYGYEYQGDNLIIARINVLETFVDHAKHRWKISPSLDEVEHAAHIISWNLWQMDGLSGAVPLDQPVPADQTAFPDLCTFRQEVTQPTLFDLFEDESKTKPKEVIPLCVIYDWEEDMPKTYVSLRDERV